MLKPESICKITLLLSLNLPKLFTITKLFKITRPPVQSPPMTNPITPHPHVSPETSNNHKGSNSPQNDSPSNESSRLMSGSNSTTTFPSSKTTADQDFDVITTELNTSNRVQKNLIPASMSPRKRAELLLPVAGSPRSTEPNASESIEHHLSPASMSPRNMAEQILARSGSRRSTELNAYDSTSPREMAERILVLSGSPRSTELNPSDTVEHNLIPPLTNDIGLSCLARVPRRYHPFLSLLSKAHYKVVTSEEFFEERQNLKCTERLAYIRIEQKWLSVNLEDLQQMQVPPMPVMLTGSTFASMGSKIYGIGGSTTVNSNLPSWSLDAESSSSSEVWILDCHTNKWQQGPRMNIPRIRPMILVFDSKLYIFGGNHRGTRQCWVESLDIDVGAWERIPSPCDGYSRVPRSCSVVNEETIYVWTSLERYFFYPKTKTWDKFESWEKIPRSLSLDPSHGAGVQEVFYVGGVPYSTSSFQQIQGLNRKTGKWMEVQGAQRRLTNFKKAVPDSTGRRTVPS